MTEYHSLCDKWSYSFLAYQSCQFYLIPTYSCIRSSNEPFYPLNAFRDSRLQYILVCHTKWKFNRGQKQGVPVTLFSLFFFLRLNSPRYFFNYSLNTRKFNYIILQEREWIKGALLKAVILYSSVKYFRFSSLLYLNTQFGFWLQQNLKQLFSSESFPCNTTVFFLSNRK